MDGKGGWKEQPVILVEGQTPFFADHPQPYIDKLRELRDDPRIERGSFYTMIGQLRDALELSWNKESQNGENGANPNSLRPSRKRN